MDAHSFLLADRIKPDEYDLLCKAVTSHWGDDFKLDANDPKCREMVDAVVFLRHDNTVRYGVPWLERVRPLAGAHVIDFGSGCGSSALAFSHFAKTVTGFEIHPPSVKAFQARMDFFGARNAYVIQSDPSDIIHRAVDEIRPGTVVVMLAVVEHLLDSERLEYLTEIWRKLAPGDILAVLETPNYFSWFDSHTFQVPFAHMVPDNIFCLALEHDSRDLRFKKTLLETAKLHGSSAILDQRRRLGLGATHHLFEVAFGIDLNEVVVADGFQKEMTDWFTILPDDRLLLSAFDMYNVQVPVGFARSVLSFVFRKPASMAQANEAKSWNTRWREEVIATHSMVRELENHRRLVSEYAARDLESPSGEQAKKGTKTSLFRRLLDRW